MAETPATLRLEANPSGLMVSRDVLQQIAERAAEGERSVRRMVDAMSSAAPTMTQLAQPGGWTGTGGAAGGAGAPGLMPPPMAAHPSAAALQQVQLENWSMRQGEMATERMLHPAYQAQVERAHDREMELLGLPQWRQDLARTMGGPLGRMGLIAGAGYLGHQALSTWSNAAGSYWQQGAVEAAGLGSGDLGTAMQASVQASYGRQRALTQAAWGTGSTVGTGLMAGGAFLAATPAGLPMMIAGALISAASEFGSKAADAMLAKAQAQETAAAGALTRFVGAYRPITQAAAQAGAYGRTVTGATYYTNRGGPGFFFDEPEVKGLADIYGFSAPEGAQREAAFARGGGRGLGINFLLAAERGWQLSADQQAAFARGVAPGQGAGFVRGGNIEQYTRTTIADAIKLGMDTARIPDYLQRISALNAQFVERGIGIDAASLAQVVTGMQAGGLSPWAATAATQNMQGYGGNLLSQMAGMRVPQGATQALVMRGLMQRFGGFDEAMGGLEGLLSSGQFPDFLKQTTSSMGLSGGISTAIMMQLTGLGPGAAEKALKSGRVSGLGGETEEGAAARVMKDLASAPILKADALAKSMEAAAVAAQNFQVVADLLLSTTEAEIVNFHSKIEAAWAKLMEALGGTGARGSAGTGRGSAFLTPFVSAVVDANLRRKPAAVRPTVMEHLSNVGTNMP